MEDLNKIIKEITDNGYDQELVDIFIRDLLEADKEYD